MPLQNPAVTADASACDKPHARVTELKPLLISVREFGHLCGCGKTESFRIISEKKVRTCLLGRKRLVSYEDAERLVADALERGSL